MDIKLGNLDPENSIDREIISIYHQLKENLRSLADAGKAEECLAKIGELWLKMNRFRNADIQFYFDEDLNEIAASLNSRRFDTSHLLTKKEKFRIAFTITNLTDLGGASVPHRFMLESCTGKHYQFEQFILVTNFGNVTQYRDTEQYRYIAEKIRPTGFCHLDPGTDYEKGKLVEQWIYDNQIDFVVAAPDPAMLYALSSKPAPFQAVLSQDCYTYTLGPGSGDFTIYVTTDQIFKYRYKTANKRAHFKNIMLPLHPPGYAESAQPLKRAEIGVPEDAILSATTNLWKSFFGDSEILFEGIAALMRRFPKYHHVLAGTPRCLDSLEFFLNKNPDLKERIRYIGPVQNMYRLLKSVDFYVNSYPTSGGSDLEAAFVGKPTIELISNRNLNLHGCEFMRTRECEAYSLSEFVKLGEKFITDANYRSELGQYLKAKVSREFDKGRIIKENIYESFLEEFEKKLLNPPVLPSLETDQTLEYEKLIALFNAFGRTMWDDKKRKMYLSECVSRFPSRPFGWIKSLEEAIRNADKGWFDEINRTMPEFLKLDYRVQFMLGLGHWRIGETEIALRLLRMACELTQHDQRPVKLAALIMLELGNVEGALETYPEARSSNIENLRTSLAQEFLTETAFFYNY